MDTSNKNRRPSPFMLTPRQNNLLRQLVADRMEAMVSHLPEHATLQEDPEILNSLEELSDLNIALSESACHESNTGGGPEKPGMHFTSEELADIQRFAMYGMTAVERALMNESENITAPIAIKKDREEVQNDLTQFRSTFGKLTLAFLSGSGANEIKKRLKK